MKITLKQIKKCKPCKEGWRDLLEGLNKKKADNAEFDAKFVLKNNGLADFCWVLDEVLDKKKELRLFAYWNAKNCLKSIPKDEKKEFEKVINTANLYAYGVVDNVALVSAYNSARESTGDSICNSAYDSAWHSACKSACKSACNSTYKSYIKKAERKLLKILDGDLPKMYTGKNHY